MSQSGSPGDTGPVRGAGWTPPVASPSGLTTNESVTAAAHARSAGWSADVTVDLGDTHDKGEDSLCVGETA